MKTIFDIEKELTKKFLLHIFVEDERSIYVPGVVNPKIIISETPEKDIFQVDYINHYKVCVNYKKILEHIDEYVKDNTPKHEKTETKVKIGTQERIAEILDGMKDLLLYKNQKYGDSAINPIGIFTKHLKEVPENTASILVRLDDKLSRVKNADSLRTNDISDIIGYCSLLLISMDVTPEDIAKFKD